MKKPAWNFPVKTADGRFVARYSEKGLAELEFPSLERTADHSRRGNEAHTPRKMEPPHVGCYRIRHWHRATVAALKNVLAGRTPGKLPPLDLSGGTEFQRKVWIALRKIARGRTKSYGEIARAIGKPKAVRAVGGACGANPIPILVPCHRVLAAHGKLGGFGGGLDWKRKLLAREGIMFR